MAQYALYRLPHQDSYTYLAQTQGTPLIIPSVEALDGREGFVFAPFSPSEECPILLMQPDVVKVMRLPAAAGSSCHHAETAVCRTADSTIPSWDAWDSDAEWEDYEKDFACFHHELTEGHFDKIVLARKSKVVGEHADAEQMFMEACHRYPHLFVALVSMEQSGTWLMATPEILLEGGKQEWKTMALAGTMAAQSMSQSKEAADDTPIDYWSAKNIEEQQIVTSYIEHILRPCSDDFQMKGPYTVHANNLVHLRTDFHFHLSPNHSFGSVLSQLFPTPAVCGMPKEKAQQFILAHEHTPRKYYSGFVGPLHPEGHTHLYVTLRCMQISDGACELYAGGGLLKESTAMKEFEETKQKMQTMFALLR